MGAYAYKEEVPCLYTTAKDLEDRLSGTICRYEGLPVYVQIDMDDGPVLNLHDPRTMSFLKKISPDDEKFDISMIECMYLNYTPNKKKKDDKNLVIYLSRHPAKKWKQGMYSSYCMSKHIDGGPNHNYDNESMVRSEGMYQAIIHNYPPFEDIMRQFDKAEPGQVMEFALSQDIAIKRSEVGVVFVFYRCSMVGWIPPLDRRVNVTNDELKWVVDRYLSRLKLISG